MKFRERAMGGPEQLSLRPSRMVHQLAWGWAMCFGVGVTLGRIFGLEWLMKPLSDMRDVGLLVPVALVLGGLSLWFWRDPKHRWRIKAGQGCAVAVMLIGALSAASYLIDWISEPRFQMRLDHPMAFNTAITTTLAGGALWWLDFRTHKGKHPAEWLVLVAILPPLAALVGHIYDVREFTNPFPFSPRAMALSTALGLMALCVAILTARPERGWMARVTKDTPEGVVARKLLPSGVAILLMLGWLTHTGENFGLFEHEEGSAILVTASILTLGLLIRQSMNVLAELESHRRSAESDLHRSEERLRLALEAARIATWDLDLRTNEVSCSEAGEEIFGMPRGSLGSKGGTFLDRIHPDDRDIVITRARRAAAGIDERYQAEYRIHWPDGSVHWIASRGEVFRDAEGRPIRIAGTSMDITERKLMERELIEMSNREQRRLGQDLHDDLGQWLTGIHLQARAFVMRLEEIAKAEAAQARRIADNVAEAIQRTRMLAHGMAPAVIETEGLPVALRDLAADTEQISQIRCHCECDAALTFRDQEAALQLYRITQEAICNAIRHGEANEVRISLEASECGRARLIIRDNGKGLPKPLPKPSGLGLRLMQYRASLVGGTLDVSRAEGGGTEVVCSFPRHL